MPYLLRSLTSWTTLLGTIATIVGLIQSRGWLATLGAISFATSVAAIAYARTQRLKIDGASIEIEGISIDAVNAANLRRRVNRSLMIQTADHFATIDGGDLKMVWRYAGYCRASSETALEFSVDSTDRLPLSQLDCYGYDLKRDPEKQHKIEPISIGPDGISKKIALPFLEPLRAREPFDVMLHCRLPSTYKPGIGYYISTLSFDQDRVGRCTVHLTFLHQKPEWVRVYECDATNRPRLLKTLHALRNDEDRSEYKDAAENIKAQSSRFYLFRRGDI